MITNKTSNSNLDEASIIYSYLTGLFTAFFIFLMFFLFIGYKLGYSNILNYLNTEIFTTQAYSRVLRLPDEVLQELTQMKAPIGNAYNPTNVAEHDTVLVRPDNELGFVLRPNVKLSVSLLRSTQAFNVDPPVLHILHEESLNYSNKLKNYLQDEARLNYSYSTNDHGFRETVPHVISENEILIVGDSVAFGVGVDNENTVASQLQKLIGYKSKIINAGVGNYDGHQAFLMAKKLSEKRTFSGLIYIACQNDFTQGEDWSEDAKKVLTKISSISDRFHNRIIIMLETYMEYNLHDFFLEKGWSDKFVQNTHLLRAELPQLSKDLGFAYRDWTEVVNKFMNQEKSIFSRFALYSDHAHLSPRGNRLMAQELYSIIQQKWL